MHPYQEALQQSGYDYKLKYTTQPNSKQNRNRQRQITWFNPPFSSNVSTNIGSSFLKLIEKSFPRNNPLRKIFNKNTLKLSYSCMPNIKAIINSNNKRKISKHKEQHQQELQQTQHTQQARNHLDHQQKPQQTNTNMPVKVSKNCNCRNKDTCPLNGECLVSNIIYQATISTADKVDTYVGSTATTFKTRYGNHKLSFNNEKHMNATGLSRHAWNLKKNNIEHSITWKIIQKSNPYTSATKRCNLCTTEKFFIICQPERSTLNKRNELVSACRHRQKFLLENT
jgi:hypothetical protein